MAALTKIPDYRLQITNLIVLLTFNFSLPFDMSCWRLILSPHADPYTNMAVDEAVLQSFIGGVAGATLRIYGWHSPAISLGITQKPERILNIAACIKDNIPFVRRMSGGEAVFHADELTYSIVCSKHDLQLPDSIKQSFMILTAFIINAYKQLGQNAYFAGQVSGYTHGDDSSFCLATKEKFDILIQDKKIGGNAQKRNRDVIFQHGSIPLQPHIDKCRHLFQEDLKQIGKNVIALSQALKKRICFEEMRGLLIDSFRRTFAVELAEEGLSSREQELAAVLKDRKYSTREWNYHRRIKKPLVAEYENSVKH